MAPADMAADRSWRWISWLILGIGGLTVLGGLALGQGSLRLALYGERSDGEVTEMRRDGDTYVPIVRFRSLEGDWHDVKDLGSGAPDFAVGDQVTIYYDPGNPDDFRIATFDRLWLSAIIVTGFGCFWLMFGAIAWALSRDIDIAVLGERAFSAIALVAVILGAFATWNAAALYGTGARTEGTVSEIRESHYTDQVETRPASGREMRRDVERTSYAPAVRFRAGEGREIEFLGRGGSGTSFAPGDRVTVVYDPANPIRARILSFTDLWLPAVAAWGVVLTFGGAVVVSRHFRSRRNQ
jgi:Protein of unknown function (DUF3592)